MAAVTTATLPTTMNTDDDTTALLVRMTPAQLDNWTWLADEDGTADLMHGWEVRDTTGALLGLALSFGHLTGYVHARWYDPATDDFYAAGEGDRPLHGAARVVEMRRRNVGPVPAGQGFELGTPRYFPNRSSCYAGICGEDCPKCQADWRLRIANVA